MDMTEIVKFDQQVGRIKLSEAIRIGAKMRPKCTSSFFSDDGSCALGAAVEAIGMKSWAESFFSRSNCWPYAQTATMFGVTHNIIDRVWQRSDDGQTREQCADWLESIGY
jgi:hypothetical protein